MRSTDVVIPIVFPDYLIAVDTPAYAITVPDLLPGINVLPDRIKIPSTKNRVAHLGHAGVLLIDGSRGLTRYYEYGRYDAAQLGIARAVFIPDVSIAKNGRPTRRSLAKVLAQISQKSGQRGRISGAYIELDSPAFATMDATAHARLKMNGDRKRPPYDLVSNSCLHFMKSVTESGGAVLPIVLMPNPAGYILEVQMVANSLEFRFADQRLEIEDIVLED